MSTDWTVLAGILERLGAQIALVKGGGSRLNTAQ
jgi:hypothetical protein